MDEMNAHLIAALRAHGSEPMPLDALNKSLIARAGERFNTRIAELRATLQAQPQLFTITQDPLNAARYFAAIAPDSEAAIAALPTVSALPHMSSEEVNAHIVAILRAHGEPSMRTFVLGKRFITRTGRSILSATTMAVHEYLAAHPALFRTEPFPNRHGKILERLVSLAPDSDATVAVLPAVVAQPSSALSLEEQVGLQPHANDAPAVQTSTTSEATSKPARAKMSTEDVLSHLVGILRARGTEAMPLSAISPAFASRTGSKLKWFIPSLPTLLRAHPQIFTVTQDEDMRVVVSLAPNPESTGAAVLQEAAVPPKALMPSEEVNAHLVAVLSALGGADVDIRRLGKEFLLRTARSFRKATGQGKIQLHLQSLPHLFRVTSNSDSGVQTCLVSLAEGSDAVIATLPAVQPIPQPAKDSSNELQLHSSAQVANAAAAVSPVLAPVEHARGVGVVAGGKRPATALSDAANLGAARADVLRDVAMPKPQSNTAVDSDATSRAMAVSSFIGWELDMAEVPAAPRVRDGGAESIETPPAAPRTPPVAAATVATSSAPSVRAPRPRRASVVPAPALPAASAAKPVVAPAPSTSAPPTTAPPVNIASPRPARRAASVAPVRVLSARAPAVEDVLDLPVLTSLLLSCLRSSGRPWLLLDELGSAFKAVSPGGRAFDSCTPLPLHLFVVGQPRVFLTRPMEGRPDLITVAAASPEGAADKPAPAAAASVAAAGHAVPESADASRTPALAAAGARQPRPRGGRQRKDASRKK